MITDSRGLICNIIEIYQTPETEELKLAQKDVEHWVDVSSDKRY